MNLQVLRLGAGFLIASLGLSTEPVRAHGPGGVATNLETLPLLTDVVPDAVQISPHVPNMGAHWAAPGTSAEGPFYCVIEERVVCVEYMFAAEDFAAGKQWTSLVPGIDTPAISHLDIEYLPEGIPNRAEPLYQVHLYFAGPDVLAD